MSEHTSHDVKTLLAVLTEGSLSRDRGFANMIQKEKREHITSLDTAPDIGECCYTTVWSIHNGMTV